MTDEIRLIHPDRIDREVTLWLHEIYQHSQSVRSQEAYGATIRAYRAALRQVGLDLDSEDVDALATVAQAYTSRRQRGTGPVAPATVSQRLGILSSFFLFATRRRLRRGENPIQLLSRPAVQEYRGAEPLPAETITARLAQLDRSSPATNRDFHLLLLGFSTGRRVSELVSLRTQHVSIAPSGLVTLTFDRCKGNRRMVMQLPPQIGASFAAYLERLYPEGFPTLPPDRPVWWSYSHRNAAEPITTATARRACEKYLGISKTHSLRHSFSLLMLNAEATVLQLQAMLGHANLATTQKYVRRLSETVNPVADKMDAALLGPTPRR